MRKLLLILIFSNFTFAQSGIEIRLVNSGIGTPVPSWVNGWYTFNTSNDSGLNAILQTYGTTGYDLKEGHPYYNTPIIQISFTSTNISQFIADLQAYSSVVAYAHQADMYSFNDVLQTHILNPTVGTPNGMSNGIVVTNDLDLNLIFQNHNVIYYSQSYQSSTISNTLQYYNVVCICEANLLKTALDNYSSVTDATTLFSVAYLSSQQFETTNNSAVIYPNPFTNIFTIDTKEIIANYDIFDISGKQLIKTNSKTELDNQTQNLKTGIYLLRLETVNGKVYSQKLIKK